MFFAFLVKIYVFRGVNNLVMTIFHTYLLEMIERNEE
jgi:hypothetical protein